MTEPKWLTSICNLSFLLCVEAASSTFNNPISTDATAVGWPRWGGFPTTLLSEMTSTVDQPLESPPLVGMGPADRMGIIAIPKCGTTTLSATLALKHPFVEHTNPCIPGYPLIFERNLMPYTRPRYSKSLKCAYANLSDLCRPCRRLDFVHLQHARYDEVVAAFDRVRGHSNEGKLSMSVMLRNPVHRVCSEYDFSKPYLAKQLGIRRWRQRYWGMKDYDDTFLTSISSPKPHAKHFLGRFSAHNRETRFLAGIPSSTMVTKRHVALAVRNLEKVNCIATLEGCGAQGLLRCIYRTIFGSRQFATENSTSSFLNGTAAEIFYPGQSYSRALTQAWSGSNSNSGLCATMTRNDTHRTTRSLRLLNWADQILYERAKVMEAARGCTRI